MRHRPLRPAVAVAFLTVAATVCAPLSAAPGSAAARSASRFPAVSTGAGGAARSLLMINGSRLLDAGGARVPGIVPGTAGPLATRMLALNLGGAAYLFPLVALPYLGHGLAPSMFDTRALRRAETPGRLPVTVTYQGKAPSLPGVTITGASGGTARGYLTQAGASAFGAALARQFAADHASGSYGQDGMFAGGVSVSLAGAPAAAARPAPAFPMHTLTVTAANLAGRPDTGDGVFVFNADNAGLFSDPVESFNFFDHGATRFSVPAGHYWAIGIFETQLRSKLGPAVHSVVVPQVTMSRDVTVHMAARSASSQVQMVTPRPSVPNTFNTIFELRHPTPHGPVGAFWFLGGRLFLNQTTRRPTAGTLQTYVFAELDSPAKAAGTPYQYDAAYADTSGLLGSQRHVVRPDGLATVHSRYYSDAAGTGYFSRFGAFAAQWKDVFFALFQPMTVPRRETEYLTGNPAIFWSDSFVQSNRALAGGQADALRTFHAGQRLTENWNAYPLHAGYNTNLTGRANPLPALPSASRAGDTLTLDVMPFSDSIRGHVSASGFFGGFEGPAGRITGHYEIDQNGKVIASGNPLKGLKEVGPLGEFHASVPLRPRPSMVSFVLDAARTGPIFTLSTVSRTVWTWRSARDGGARVPAGWGCVLRPTGVAAGHECAVQPMLTLGYRVAGLSLGGSVPAGAQAVHVSVGHLQLATAARVTRAKAAVSFDGGKTWHHAKVSGHRGRYTVSFSAPAGTRVSLRTSAADAAGGTITETILSAYQTTS